MVKCRATQDGLLASGQYITEGEVFLSEKCPRWAEEIEGKKTPAAPAAGKKTAASAKGKVPAAPTVPDGESEKE